jgi:hypothetical protein
MAGFQVSTTARSWLFTEDHGETSVLDIDRAQRQLVRWLRGGNDLPSFFFDSSDPEKLPLAPDNQPSPISSPPFFRPISSPIFFRAITSASEAPGLSFRAALHRRIRRGARGRWSRRWRGR